ncbi:MAG: hypothetical protein ACRDBL_10090, partial [Rhabdaerophilum sp.]
MRIVIIRFLFSGQLGLRETKNAPREARTMRFSRIFPVSRRRCRWPARTGRNECLSCQTGNLESQRWLNLLIAGRMPNVWAGAQSLNFTIYFNILLKFKDHGAPENPG